MDFLTTLKARARAVLAFAGDAGHRRSIAIVLALVITHFAGKEMDVENVDQILSLVIAALGAAWSHKTFGDAK